MVRSRQDDPGAGPRFVLTGSFNGLNRGDSAMQLAAAQAVLQRWPNAQIAIHLSYPEDDADLYRGYEIVTCSRRQPLLALRAISRALAWRATGSEKPLTPELESYRTADFVIDLSGDGLTETFGWRCPISHTVPLLLARLMRKPYCLMAQTIGPFRRTGPWVRWILKGAQFVTARDLQTMEYLRGWRLSPEPKLTADLAFLLQPSPAEKAKDYIASIGHYDPGRPVLGVTPSNLYNIRTVGRSSSWTTLPELLALVANAIEPVAKELQAQVLVIPHVFGPGPDYDDRIAANRLASLLETTTPVLVVKEALSPPELKAIIGCCNLFIGVRMHSVIAAVSLGVPTIALAYSHKLHGLISRLGLSQYLLDLGLFSQEDLANRIRGLWSERETIAERLQGMISNEIVPLANRNFEVLAAQLRCMRLE